MKKFLALALFAAMIIGLAIPVTASNIPLPICPKADIVLDGVLDDGYGEVYVLTSYRDGNGDGATAKMWSAWNEKGIYYFMEVYDTTPNHDHSNSYERDNVEFFIDWNAAKPDSNTIDDDDPSWQVRVASAPNEDGNFSSATLGDDNGLPAEYIVVKPLVGNDLNGGYILEVLLPISFTGGKAKPLAEGRVLFVDFQVADNQEDAGRSSQVFLDGMADDVDSQWSTPDAFQGILTLGAAKPAPVVDEPAPSGGGEAADAEIAPVVAAVTAPAARTGDGATMFIVLAILMAGAVVVTKRVKA